MRKWSKPFWIAVALVFLFEAWVWDLCVRLGRRLLQILPLERLKVSIAKAVQPLPPPTALLVFLIPLAIIEPFKFLALWLLATGHWALGILCFVAAKFVAFGVVAFLFDLLRDKLLSMAWLASLYRLTLKCIDWAHALTAPYKAIVRARIVEFRSVLAHWESRQAGSSGFLGKALRLRRHYRRSSPKV